MIVYKLLDIMLVVTAVIASVRYICFSSPRAAAGGCGTKVCRSSCSKIANSTIASKIQFVHNGKRKII